MAKKTPKIGTPLGYGPCGVNEVSTPQITDNNPDGPYSKPSYASDPANGYPSENVGGTKRFSFTELVGQGESPNKGDVNVITPDGISSSKGKDKGRQYTWGGGTDGEWNDNDFDNGNLTGM
jgi:hypothetical protein